MNYKKIILLFIVFFSLVYTFTEENLKIHFINAGEGDSILIQTPERKNILIDTGNLITGIKVYKYLINNKVDTIHHLILTHPHPDHIGGVFAIAQLLKIKSIYDNGEYLNDIAEKQDIYRWYRDLIRKDRRYKKLSKGKVIKIGSVKLKVLWPSRKMYEDWNANSLVMMLQYGSFKCLFMGDATVKTESELLLQYRDLKADVLKAGHHGAGDTGSTAFINKVKPEVVIISINKNNRRGYPAGDVITSYKKSGAKVYTTYNDGSIIISVKKNSTYVIDTIKD